jgi:hypothetical protein
MRWLALAVLAATLGGCGNGVDPEAMRCGALPDIPSYSKCIERYNARVARQRVAAMQAEQWNTPAEDNAAILLMGATAFANGYNQARQPPMLMCFNTGSIVMCQ